MTVFDRLGYNFDSTQFGNSVSFTDGQKAFYTGQTDLKPWQISAMANSDVTGYYQNPMANNLITLSGLSSSINTAANLIYTTANTGGDLVKAGVATSLMTASNTLSTVVSSFKIHTDNLSNVTKSTDSANTPDYEMAISVGRQILSIVNQTDNIQNNIPILGNFTSLTLVNAIAANVVTLTADNIIMANPSVTSSSMNLVISHIQSCYTLMQTRQNADVNFYANSISIINDYDSVSKLNNTGVVSDSLIQNYIGTPKLISNLQS